MPELNNVSASKPTTALLALSRWCEWLAMVVLFALMALTGVDVVARYLFNSPIRGAFELVEIMLATLVFLALPASIRHGSHIKVELINSFGSELAERWVQFLVTLLSLIIFAVLSWQLYEHATKLRAYGLVSDSLEIPLYLIGWLAAACCLLCTLLLLRQLFAPQR